MDAGGSFTCVATGKSHAGSGGNTYGRATQNKNRYACNKTSLDEI